MWKLDYSQTITRRTGYYYQTTNLRSRRCENNLARVGKSHPLFCQLVKIRDNFPTRRVECFHFRNEIRACRVRPRGSCGEIRISINCVYNCNCRPSGVASRGKAFGGAWWLPVRITRAHCRVSKSKGGRVRRSLTVHIPALSPMRPRTY